MTPVNLTDTEWQQVCDALSFAPWRKVNHLIVKISEQVRAQATSENNRHVGNSGADNRPSSH
jgi:hypothetical protein